MMRSSLLLAAVGLLAVASAVPADKEFLTKQHEILKLLNKPHELNFYADQSQVGKEYDPLAHLADYKVKEK
jgi:hypothetical protein